MGTLQSFFRLSNSFSSGGGASDSSENDQLDPFSLEISKLDRRIQNEKSSPHNQFI